MRRVHRLAACAAGCLVASTGALVAVDQLASAATAGFGYGSPAFVNSAAPATDSNAGTFFSSDNSGEPSIGINWNTGAAMYMASTDTYKLTFDTSQDPPAVTWADRSSPYSLINVDPILATDRDTGLTLAGGDDGACAVMSATTTDGGDDVFDTSAWTPTAPCPFTADHPTMGIGPAPAGSPGAALGQHVAYFCQQTDLDHCSHSIDGGTTWSPSVPTAACAGLHGHVKISADGTAYLPSVNCVDADGNLAVGAMTSSDGGFSWDGYGISGAPEPDRGFDPSVATASDNTVYESWARAGDYHPVVTWSKDHGASWAPQVDLANTVSPALTASTFQAAVAGDSGRAAVAYLGTSTPVPGGATPFDAGFNGVWYLYVSYTYDGGATWQTVQATTDPVQRGSIDDGGFNSSGQRNLLDFIDASVTKDGRVVVAYADGCLQCSSAAQSTHAWASVAYQSAGAGLFSAYDTAPPAA